MNPTQHTSSNRYWIVFGAYAFISLVVLTIMDIAIGTDLSTLVKFIVTAIGLNVAFNIITWKIIFKTRKELMLLVLMIITVLLGYPLTFLLYYFLRSFNDAVALGLILPLSTLLVHVTRLDRLLMSVGNKKVG